MKEVTHAPKLVVSLLHKLSRLKPGQFFEDSKERLPKEAGGLVGIRVGPFAGFGNDAVDQAESQQIRSSQLEGRRGQLGLPRIPQR